MKSKIIDCGRFGQVIQYEDGSYFFADADVQAKPIKFACPKCGGLGTCMVQGAHQGTAGSYYDGGNLNEEICPKCDGKGWVR